MNRSHRIIWNETRKAFVVASEGAKAKGKPSSTRKAITVAVVGALGALAGMPALAASSCPGGGSLVTISTAETSTCQLNAGDSLTVTNAGSITSTFNGILVQSVAGVGSISNSGSISGNNNGILLMAQSTIAGNITNNTGGTISGGTDGIQLSLTSVSGSIINSGSIAATVGGRSAIYVGDSTVSGSITNNTGGTISGGNEGVWLNHATVSGGITNSGSISGVNHGIISFSGSEAGSITNNTNGAISGGNTGISLSHSTVSGSISNSGSISGTGQSGIWINGSTLGSIINSGNVSGGNVGFGIAGSTISGITNNAGASISGAGSHGIFLSQSIVSGGILNSGSISGGNNGILLTNSTISGSITNNAGGTISGDNGNGIMVNYSTVSGGISNSGSISGHNFGIDLNYSSASNISNSGSISGAGQAGMIIYASSVGDFSNSGTISGGNAGFGILSALVSSITNNAGGTISGGTYGIALTYGSVSGSITNSGNISGGNVGAIGISLSHMNVGSITNNAGGTISGGTYGIKLDNSSVGSISNSSTISGGSYVGIYATNSTISGNITNNAGGLISGGSAGIYLINGSVSGSITNSGNIFGGNSGSGISLSHISVGSITNNAGGSISGGYVGINLSNTTISGSITNHAGGLISGGVTGIYLSNSSVGSLINSGTISGGNYAVYLESNSTLPTIDITGNNTARFIGDVKAWTTDVNVKAGATFTNDNAFSVLSFTIEHGGIFNMGAGTSTSGMANGVETGSGFTNAGRLNVAEGVTATITGDYSQTAAGIFQTAASSDTSYGKLVVSGTATLAAGTGINVNVASVNTLANGNILSSVISAGTLSASTFSITDNSALFDFSAVLNGNAVDLLTNKAAAGVLTSVVATGFTPGVGAANVLDGFVGGGTTGTDTDNIVTALGQLGTQKQVTDAVQQTLPLMTGSMAESTKSTLASINRVIESRQHANRGSSSGDDFYGDKQVWIKPLGAWTNQDDRKGVTGYSANTYGLVGGIDGEISDTTRVGVALAYAHTNVDSNSSAAPQSADIDNYQAILYGSHSLDERTTLSLQGNLGTNTTKGDRVINFGGLNRIASSEYDSWSGHIGAGLSRSYAINPQTTLAPGIRIDYTKLHAQGYTETGAGALNLNVGSSNAEELILLAESRVAYQVTDHATLIGNLGLGYDALASRNSITAAYTGGGASFITQGIDPSPFLMRGGAGYVVTNSNAIEVTARLDFEVREHFDNETASVKVKVPF
ncbi:autotransporter domain-containing protein [Methyloradius palustris]|uniref:Autotransporter domain-containing protein n=1 Tax=Methyloradius palustris TaxID=2778876 RepID=A0A8D5GB49_9PROT|nr:autotransporter domain-containing protein [Methyloradius palustris]BCM24288.1 hypothetical protein ZMTM_05470 [Methyloradius palustris]